MPRRVGSGTSSGLTSTLEGKWEAKWLLGFSTDAKPRTTWDAAQRTGSRGIFVWESSDLVNWVNERLVVVEDPTAGMVWAPEAIWDPAKSKPLR